MPKVYHFEAHPLHMSLKLFRPIENHMAVSSKKLLQIGILIGICMGCVAGFLFPFNMLNFWRRLNFFPYHITKIVDVMGINISVETQTGEFFILNSQCEQELCWQRVDPSKVLFDRSGYDDPYYDLQVNTTCKFEHFTYPLFRRIKMCAGTNYPVMETTEWVYVALTENGEVWVWDGGFIIPPACFIFPPIFALLGIVPGVFLGFLLVATKKLREIVNRKNPNDGEIG